ncbi:MAG TPA: hypothetical protein VE010_13410, partial [Thermoanaerobaculia bacterium]|nr:hypothetical protein [Thermoanaerobaculia bacterium]
MARRVAGVIPTAAAVLFVIFTYAFFGSAGTLEFRRVVPERTYYGNLTEGFLRGQLNMISGAEPEILRLENPYELKQREGLAYLWDASLYNGRYYLYFSPVPILLFVLPFRVTSGGLPSDELSAAFFFVWAFLASVAFAWRALRHAE